MNNPSEIWRKFRLEQDEAAFAALYDITAPSVWTICLRILRNEEDAQEAFQGTYARLLEAARRPPGNEAPLELARRLAVLEASALRKRRARLQKREVVMEETPEHPREAGQMDAAALRECRTHIETMAGTMDEELRVPLLLHYLDGLSQRAIADAMGVSVSTVNDRIAKARKELAPRLEKRGIRSAQDVFPALLPLAFLLSPPSGLNAATVFIAAKSASTATVAAGTGGSAAAAVAGKVMALAAACALVAAVWVVLNRTPEPPSAMATPAVTIASAASASSVVEPEPESTPAVATPVATTAPPLTTEPPPVTTPPPAGTASIQGAVYDDLTGHPIEATVYLFNSPEGEWEKQTYNKVREPIANASTTENGRFELAGLAAGPYLLFVDSEKHLLQNDEGLMYRRVLVEEGEQLSGVELRAFPGNVVTGRVTDRRTGEPLAGVRVESVNQTLSVARQHWRREFLNYDARDYTDADGRYRLEPVFGQVSAYIRDGVTSYERNGVLKVQLEGYTTRQERPDPRTMINQFPLTMNTREVEFDTTLWPTIKMAGRVEDRSGAAVPEARLFISTPSGGTYNQDGSSVSSAEDGSFTMAVPVDMDFTVKVKRDGFLPAEQKFRKMSEAPTKPVVIRLEPESGDIIRFRLTNEDGFPLGGHMVRLEKPRDSDGVWDIAQMAQANFEKAEGKIHDFDKSLIEKGHLRLRVAGTTTLMEAVHVITPEDITRTEPIHLVMRKPVAETEFFGRIYDREGAPLHDAIVFVPGREFSATTDANGAYTINVPAETEVLAVRHPDNGISGIRTLDPARSNDLFWKDANAIAEVHVYDRNLDEPVTDFTLGESPYWSQNILRDPERPHVFFVEQGVFAKEIRLVLSSKYYETTLSIAIPDGELYFVSEQRIVPMGDRVGLDYWQRVSEKKGGDL